MAVEVCGSPLTYAHALARMAESRVSPRLMMAANSRPIAARVARLLGVGKEGEVDAQVRIFRWDSCVFRFHWSPG